jgi:hypothetical protein
MHDSAICVYENGQKNQRIFAGLTYLVMVFNYLIPIQIRPWYLL